MQLETQVTFHNLAHSDSIERYIRERVAKLETFFARIVACRVVVESPHKHQHNGRHYRVRVDVTVPRGEVVVSHAPDESTTNEDVYAAVDEAFDRMGRRLEDHSRRLRGDVKPREETYRDGHVSKLWSYENYGFIETADGSEIYFHRNSVLNHGFDRLQIGSAVRFVEEDGDKGPQASTVAVIHRASRG